MKNWWYYYKWYVICGAAVFGTAVYLIGNALGLFQTEPDYQIAYVGGTALPQDTVDALERAFASISWDFNGDGEVLVKVNQYVSNAQEHNPNAEALYYGYAAEMQVIADITDGESYFFLMDDPADFQKEYQILAQPDGGCPNDLDYSVEGKAIAWGDCPGLSGLELGSYSETVSGETVSASSEELLSGLYLGRRCFYSDDTVENADQCGRLWELIVLPAGSSTAPAEGTTETEDADCVTVGNTLEIRNSDKRLTLLDNMDVLAADGLYYAAWTAGNSEPYENSEGETVDLYDAQLYLLLGEAQSREGALENLGKWLAAARDNYEVTDESDLTCNGQQYKCLAYNCDNSDNPYARGISVFGINGCSAVCIELTCREGYGEDLRDMLTGFLDCCSWTCHSR